MLQHLGSLVNTMYIPPKHAQHTTPLEGIAKLHSSANSRSYALIQGHLTKNTWDSLAFSATTPGRRVKNGGLVSLHQVRDFRNSLMIRASLLSSIFS